jgi:hypothetical protein
LCLDKYNIYRGVASRVDMTEEERFVPCIHILIDSFAYPEDETTTSTGEFPNRVVSPSLYHGRDIGPLLFPLPPF